MMGNFQSCHSFSSQETHHNSSINRIESNDSEHATTSTTGLVVSNGELDLEELDKYISEMLNSIKEYKRKGKRLNIHNPSFKLNEFMENLRSKMMLDEELQIKASAPGKELREIVASILKTIGTSNMEMVGFVVVAGLLQRWGDVSKNKEDCFELLEEMVKLIRFLKQVKEHPSGDTSMENLIKETVHLVIEGFCFCSSQMKAGKLIRYANEAAETEALLKLREDLNAKYRDLQLQTMICIYNRSQCIETPLPRPRGIKYPPHAVGLEKRVINVIELLEFGSQANAVAVVLHGYGGIGKSTLAEAVFSCIDLDGCKYAMVKLFDNIHSTPRIVDLQKAILCDLQGTRDITIHNEVEGRSKIESALQSFPAVFIFIDNVLKQEELDNLLPRCLENSTKLRLLLTARDSETCLNLKLSKCLHIYEMEPLPVEDATQFFRGTLGQEALQELHPKHGEDLIHKCNGVPLLLDLVACRVRNAQDPNRAYNEVMLDAKKAYGVIMEECSAGKGSIFRQRFTELFAFNTLENEDKEAFLDISFFFQGWIWKEVERIVGVDAMFRLANRSLVQMKTEWNGKKVVTVHDVLVEIAEKQDKGTRFNRPDNINRLLQGDLQKEDLEKVKGISLEKVQIEKTIPATLLDKMHCSLRVLHLASGFSWAYGLHGRCTKKFRNLLYFHGCYPMPLHAPHLRVVRLLEEEKQQYLETKEITGLNIGDGVQGQELWPQDLTEITMIGSLKTFPVNLGNLSQLQCLVLYNCNALKDIPLPLFKLSNLKSLRLHNYTALHRFPESVNMGDLPQLEDLALCGCKNLEELPVSLCKLSKLRILNLYDNVALQELPANIGDLTSLDYLNLNGCTSLSTIPGSIGKIKSLTCISLSHCSSLNNLQEGFGQLISLKKLELDNCSTLRDLCPDFCNLSSLSELNLECCDMLNGKWMEEIGKMHSLKTVLISKSKGLLAEWFMMQTRTPWYQTSPIIAEVPFSTSRLLHNVSFQFFNNEEETLLFDGEGRPFSLSVLPPKTVILFVIELIPGMSMKWLQEITSNCHEKVLIIFVGDHTNNFSFHIHNRIIAYASRDSVAQRMIHRIYEKDVAGYHFEKTGHLSLARCPKENHSVYLVAFPVKTRGNNHERYFSQYDIVSENESMLQLVNRMSKLSRLEELSENPQENNLALLKELFEDIEVLQLYPSFTHALSKKVTIEELKEKTILLLVTSNAETLIYSNWFHVIQELHTNNTEIEVVIVILDEEYPSPNDWLNDWTASKYPLIAVHQNSLNLREMLAFLIDDIEETRYIEEFIVAGMLIKPDGTVVSKSVLQMLLRLEAEAYPLKLEVYEQIRIKEWGKLNNLTYIEFLLMPSELVIQVKKALQQGKIICTFVEDNLCGDEVWQMLKPCIPHFKGNIVFLNLGLPNPERQKGLIQFHSNQDDLNRFWKRVKYLIKEAELDYGKQEKVEVMQSVLQSVLNAKCILFDENGDMITDQFLNICLHIQSNNGLRLMQILVKGSKNERQTALDALLDIDEDE